MSETATDTGITHAVKSRPHGKPRWIEMYCTECSWIDAVHACEYARYVAPRTCRRVVGKGTK